MECGDKVAALAGLPDERSKAAGGPLAHAPPIAMLWPMRTVVLLIVLSLSMPAWAQPADLHARVDSAIQRAAENLWAQRGQDHWPEAVAGSNPRELGGRSALAVYALLAAGQSHQDPRIVQTLAWLRQLEPEGVYARSLRACALAQLPGAAEDPVLAADARWLVRALREDGAYGYTPNAPGPDAWDNSNTQMALLGAWSAAEAGVPMPAEYWRRLRNHWLRTQGTGGGWSYTGSAQRPYGSMSAAGLASLYLCLEGLATDATEWGDDGEPPAIRRGLEWLAEHFSDWENPGKGPQYFHYYLYAVERVGLASGYKHFGEHDWYAAGAAELLRTQGPDGGWGDAHDTAFALLFLARGRYPVLLSKLRYDGAWNRWPRDLARLAGWFSRRFERPVNWQVLDADAPIEQWHDAPILYLSGSGLPRFTPDQKQRLRTFALRGGLIVSSSAGNSPVFTAEIRKLYAELLPDWPLEPLDADHAVYSAHAPVSAGGLLGVSNGVRLLAVHAPSDLSRFWQAPNESASADPLALAANLYLHATDLGSLRRRGDWSWPAPPAWPPGRTVRVALLTPPAEPMPEPLAYERLAIRMARECGVGLDYAGPLPIAALPASGVPVALLSGTKDFALSPAERSALGAFLRAGGLLVVDATGGSEAFHAAARREIPPLVEDAQVGRLARSAELYRLEGYAIEAVSFRRAARQRLGSTDAPRLEGVRAHDRLAVLLSREDLTASLVGYPGHGLDGYSADSAFALLRNAILHAADRPAAGQLEVEWHAPALP